MYTATYPREEGPQYADICVAKSLVELYALYPAKFNKNKDALIANWRNGEHVSPTRVTSSLRSAVAKTGQNPPAYSLRSPRAGGATSLYRATKDIDLVAIFGRCETRPISPHLWDCLRMMAGLRDHMAMGGHAIHTSANDQARAKRIDHVKAPLNGPVGGGVAPWGWEVVISRDRYREMAPRRGASRKLQPTARCHGSVGL